jgi:multidrug efflux system membrane fusion protein
VSTEICRPAFLQVLFCKLFVRTFFDKSIRRHFVVLQSLSHHASVFLVGLSMSIDPSLSRPDNTPTVTSTRPARRIKYAALSVLAVLIIFFAWRHFYPDTAASANAAQNERSSKKGMANKPMPVQASVAVAGDLKVYLSALGNVVPPSSVIVRSRVDGELMSVNFKEGQNVQKGDVLMQIDPRPYQIALTQAEGQLAKDQAALASARQDLVRYHTLIKQDSISQQQVDQQAAAVTQSEGTVKADQGLVDNARLNLAYSRVTAPVSGKLGLRLVDPGNVVHASDANGVVVINQFQPIFVTYSIPEDNLSAVLQQWHQGNVLTVDAWDRSQTTQLANGKLQSIDNQIDPSTGTIKLKAVFANTSESLYPNQFVNVRMLVETRKSATLLPSAAIQRGAKGTFVFVVASDNTAAARPVTTGPVDGENIGILSGVKPGELVVIDGADKLKDGSTVTVISPARTTDAAQTPDEKSHAQHAASAGNTHRSRNDSGQ